MCFHVRSDVSTHWFLPCNFSFQKSLRKPEPWVNSRNHQGRTGRLTHLHWRPPPQYRWSITCWISMIWIELMVVSIPELRINREKKVNSSAEEEYQTSARAPNYHKWKTSFLDKWVPFTFKWKKKGREGEKAFVVVVIVNFKKTHKNPGSDRQSHNIQKNFWALGVLLNWHLLKNGWCSVKWNQAKKESFKKLIKQTKSTVRIEEGKKFK